MSLRNVTLILTACHPHPCLSSFCYFRLSKAAVQCLFSFLATFLCVLGQFCTQCKEMAKAVQLQLADAREVVVRK